MSTQTEIVSDIYRGNIFFSGDQGLNLGPCIYYVLSTTIELSSRVYRKHIVCLCNNGFNYLFLFIKFTQNTQIK